MTRNAAATALALIGALGSAGLARADDPSAPEEKAPRMRFYLAGGFLVSNGALLGVSGEVGLELYGVLGRVSWEGTALGGRPFTFRGWMAGYALGMGDFAPYLGIGTGTVSWVPRWEFIEPQYTIRAEATALAPEVGVIIGHRRTFMRMIASVQLLIPLSSRVTSGDPSGFRLDTSPWIVGALRLSL